MWKLYRYALTFILMLAITGALCRFSSHESQYQKKTASGNLCPGHKTMTFKNPLWLKISICAGMLISSLMAGGALYLVHEAALNKVMVPLLFFFTGFIFFVYVTLRRTTLAPFINAQISTSDEGITVTRKNRSTHTRWRQIKRIRNSPQFQLYTVYNQTKNPILIVDHSIPGFDKLKQAIESSMGTKPEGSSAAHRS